jgi:hypothetical protein
MAASVAKLKTFSSATSRASPLIGFSLFPAGSLQQYDLLPDRLLCPGGADSHHYDICLRLSHLLSELLYLGRISSQALHKKNNNNRRDAVLSLRMREPKGVRKGRLFLSRLHTNLGWLENIQGNRDQCLL